MASIRKKGDYQWHVQIRRQGQTLTKTFETRADAEAWAKIKESEIIRGVYIPTTKEAEKKALGDLIDRYITDVVPGHRGHESETARLKMLRKRQICKRSVASLRPEDFVRYRDARLKEPRSRHAREAKVQGDGPTVGAATVHRELGLFQQIIEHARREWGLGLAENPVKAVQKPRFKNARDRRLSVAEEKRLLESIDQGRNKHMKPLVLLGLETAMRQGELLGLTWGNVDFSVPAAHLPRTKNGDKRDVPLSKRAVQILRGILKESVGTAAKNLSTDEKKMRIFPTTASAVKQAWERAVERAEIENLHFHDLRHEATSRMAARIPNALALASITGHRDMQMLKRYYHPRAADLAKMLG
ncbi:MAG: site-specific integrase [Betaproteobacteria bacterium]|nr:site-specific integrase [Betaproteobacteria bacterium]